MHLTVASPPPFFAIAPGLGAEQFFCVFLYWGAGAGILLFGDPGGQDPAVCLTSVCSQPVYCTCVSEKRQSFCGLSASGSRDRDGASGALLGSAGSSWEEVCDGWLRGFPLPQAPSFTGWIANSGGQQRAPLCWSGLRFFCFCGGFLTKAYREARCRLHSRSAPPFPHQYNWSNNNYTFPLRGSDSS